MNLKLIHFITKFPVITVLYVIILVHLYWNFDLKKEYAITNIHKICRNTYLIISCEFIHFITYVEDLKIYNRNLL